MGTMIYCSPRPCVPWINCTILASKHLLVASCCCLGRRQLITEFLFQKSRKYWSLGAQFSHIVDLKNDYSAYLEKQVALVGVGEKTKAKTILLCETPKRSHRDSPKLWIRSACHLSTEPSDCPFQKLHGGMARPGQLWQKPMSDPSRRPNGQYNSIWNHFALS